MMAALIGVITSVVMPSEYKVIFTLADSCRKAPCKQLERNEGEQVGI